MAKMLDQVHIRAIYNKDPIARVVLDHVADKRRSLNAISAEAVTDLCEKARVPATREMVMATMRELAEAGAGTFLCGRRGHVSRLRFALTSRIVGLVAKGLHDLPDAPAMSVEAKNDNVVSFVNTGASVVGTVRELFGTSHVDDLKHIAAYVNKLIELREMEAGNFDLVSRPYGRRATDQVARSS